MKNVIKLLSISLFVSGVMFISCGKEVTGVTLNLDKATLAPGKTLALVASVQPEKAANKAVTWTTSDESVATVNNGLVTAIKEGTATITVTTKEGGKTADCIVTVSKTGNDPSIKDGDGNVYTAITVVGKDYSKEWLKENLKTTKYNDETPIAHITDNAAWANATSGGYCWYSNNESNKNIYGALYNYYAINEKICPKGWRVPSASDWLNLIHANGRESSAGISLKEKGTEHWSVDFGTTNESRFTALPGGKRTENGVFDSLRFLGAFWTNSQTSLNESSFIYLEADMNSAIKDNSSKKSGFSIRCIKNEAQ